jgi:hypothetical protein
MNGGEYELHFLRALGLTLLLEAPLVCLALWKGPWRISHPWPKRLACGVVPSVATLPWLWFLGPWLLSSFVLRAWVGEPAVALAEAVLLVLMADLPWKRALAISFAANAFSFGIGLLVPLG